MVYRIIWADRVAPRGAEAATSCQKLALVTTKIHKKNAKRKQLIKANPMKGCHIIKSKKTNK